ncbi:uncharacterized protein LOC115920987 [Strongylocentrotus purpuratus]|uniref:Death domain-containing protein n=1 Tax=Strongylocentrotus purpuratus TaxID=7668 RepID=A0A7M7SV90_STRPU|nr:uncharacterized protein LOC115920987 [Strongylocentrotus purpuratus]
MEQLERENGKLRTTIQLESEIRSAEQKRKAETPRWMQSLITWTNSGKLEQSVYSNVKLPNDEFADILKQIADDLSDEAKIDSLGSQLGILQGDIARALKTNMRYEQVTSRGTHLMLKQWRRGVSREDERMELRRALVAAKLLDLADRYIPQGTGTGSGPGPGPGHSQKMEDSHQLSRIDSTSAAQCSSGGQTNVSSNEPFEEGTNTSDEEGVEDNGINYSDWLSNIALTETSSENLVMLLFIKVIIDVRQKAFGG